MTQRDPVCGMNIEPQSAFAKREHMGQTFYFCFNPVRINSTKIPTVM